jgi:DNA-binding NtrC family response regulator
MTTLAPQQSAKSNGGMAAPVGQTPSEVVPSVLIVDDEKLVWWSLRQRLERDGYQVDIAETGEEAREKFGTGFDLILLDYQLPDADGLELLRELRAAHPDTIVILLTAHATVRRAVEAMCEGAFYFETKPFDVDAVALLVGRALETTRLRREVKLLTNSTGSSTPPMIGESPVMRHVKQLIEQFAQSATSTVLITGETGVGKDVAARTLHALSARAAGPFMNITCSALPDSLLESELFGHEKGAFTDARQSRRGLLEQADSGTVFLDEIGDMALPLQAKLLRFLEEKAFRRVGGHVDIRPNVRVVAATNRDLRDAARKGEFREDLYYRLAVLSATIPPVRERDGDVELLCKFLIDHYNREFRKHVRGIAPRALTMLNAHAWPGNVRELKNVIERAVLLSRGSMLDVEDIGSLMPHGDEGTRSSKVHGFRLPATGLDLQDLEIELVIQALERTGGNQTRAAALLGLNRDQIRYRMAKFGLKPLRLGKDHTD